MQREGQAHSPTKSEWDSAVLERLVRREGWWCAFERVGADAKPTERSLKGKGVGGFRGIVRKISLIVRMGSNPSGSRPNFFGRQHLTFDKGRAWMPEVERPKALHGRKANRAFIWQEYWWFSRDSAVFERG